RRRRDLLGLEPEPAARRRGRHAGERAGARGAAGQGGRGGGRREPQLRRLARRRGLLLGAGLARPARRGDAVIALRVALLLAALPLAGCFAQASVGAQRSPDGAWGASGGLAAGLHFDITDAVAAGVGVEGSLVPYRNDQGHGLAVSGPVTGYAHVALARSERHVLAVRGEASLPPGRVRLTPDRSGPDGAAARGPASA